MSKPYMISYDLNNPGQKYEDVKKIIIEFSSAYIRLQKSFWLVRTNSTPNSMAESLNNIMDSNDSLFICEINNNCQGLASEEDWKFINKSIFIHVSNNLTIIIWNKYYISGFNFF